MPRSELIQSVLRGMDVIELVAQSETGLTLREVSDSLGLKQPTAHNLIRTLVAREFVEKITSPVRYRLGPAIARLERERSNHTVVRRAAEVMSELFAEVRPELPLRLIADEEASLSFSQQVGNEVMMTLRLRLQRPGVLERPRYIFGPFQSAASLVFLAHWTPEEYNAFLRRHPFVEFGAQLWKTEARLKEFLAESRQVGYSMPPVFPSGQLRVAAPVYGEGRQLVGALGFGLWLRTSPHQRKTIVDKLLAAAQRLSDVPPPGEAVPG